MCVLLAVLVRQGRRRRLVSNKKGVNLISRTNAFVHNWQLALAIGIAGNMACQHTCTQHTHTRWPTYSAVCVCILHLTSGNKYLPVCSFYGS